MARSPLVVIVVLNVAVVRCLCSCRSSSTSRCCCCPCETNLQQRERSSYFRLFILHNAPPSLFLSFVFPSPRPSTRRPRPLLLIFFAPCPSASKATSCYYKQLLLALARPSSSPFFICSSSSSSNGRMRRRPCRRLPVDGPFLSPLSPPLSSFSCSLCFGCRFLPKSSLRVRFRTPNLSKGREKKRRGVCWWCSLLRVRRFFLSLWSQQLFSPLRLFFSIPAKSKSDQLSFRSSGDEEPRLLLLQQLHGTA